MYKGDNPTALQSVEWLKNSLLSLMGTKAYTQIKVKDICGGAKLSRQTFYNFYKEKDDILRSYLRKCLRTRSAGPARGTGHDLGDIARRYAGIAEKNLEFFRLIIDQNLEYILSGEIAARIRRSVAAISGRTPGGPAAEPSGNLAAKAVQRDSYYAAYLSGALTGALICWVKDPNRMPAGDLAALICGILSNGGTGRIASV